jgi:hypothetical protein
VTATGFGQGNRRKWSGRAENGQRACRVFLRRARTTILEDGRCGGAIMAGTLEAGMAAMLSGIALFGCSAVGIRDGTEEPRYTVLAAPDNLEIRQYGPRIAAETAIAGSDDSAALNEGFRRLAGYIFGANRGKQKIEMTVPVTQQKGETIAMTAPVGQSRGADGQSVIRFFMPAEWTMETLPVPENPAVTLMRVPGETMAVLRFTGLAGVSTIAARQAELLQKLDSTAWKPTGEPLAWFYDPPWTIPFLRRNEVAVPVASR